MPRPLLLRKPILLLASGFGAVLSLILLGLSLFLPSLLTGNYYQKSLTSLRKQAAAIKQEFSALQAGLQTRQQALLNAPFPSDNEAIFALLKQMNIDPDIEGLAYYDEAGELAVWLGNTIDFRPARPGAALLVRSKASVYLVSSQPVRRSEFIVSSRLLAFRPPIKAPYLEEYQFLKAGLRKNCQIDYWDYREDVSGFERIFARHKDEYIGQPRLESEIQRLFFPLRSEQGAIVATVNVSSPSLFSSQSRIRDVLSLAYTLSLMAAIVLLIVYLAKSYLASKRRRILFAFLFIPALLGLRLIFFPLTRLERIQSHPLFSPAQASFLSVGGLTRSPVDIFLTSLIFTLVIGSLALVLREIVRRDESRAVPRVIGWTAGLGLMGASFFIILVFRTLLTRLVSNSNVNLLRFSADLSFLLLHLSLAFLLAIALVLAFLALRTAQALVPSLRESLLLFIPALFGLSVLFLERDSLTLIAFQAALLGCLFFLAKRREMWKKGEVLFFIAILATLFIYVQLHLDSTARLRSLVQNSLRNTVLAQQNWAEFLIRQSIPEIEKRNSAILSFLKNPDESPFARSIWENTLVAKFNWYSTLEIQNNQGEILSRFSLNIPELYQPELELPLSQTWRISRLTVPSLSKAKEFILGYRDWFLDNGWLGRLTFSLTVDPEMLPFLYSANPYFELLKVSSLPSLHQQGIGFAIFDASGKLVFNPDKISAGLSPDTAAAVGAAPDGLWSSLADKGENFDVFFFCRDGRIYSLFMPRKDIMGLSVEFIKLLILYLAFALIVLVLFPALLQRKKLADVFWSFSSRVYAALITITVILLVLFSLFSHRFFHRTFTQRFIEKAEIHANFARNVMQDFIFLQMEEKTTLIAPADDLVLWISSAIANDVNLYREGRLISSSRREFFDWGLLPELIDGEAFFKVSQENRPFYTQRQRIGNFSFQTLTIPYAVGPAQFLISLPFPFEEQEIAGATEELVEFLIFVSIFFVAVVLVFARGMGQMIILPVKKLLAGTKEVSRGNLEIAVEHKSRDEMRTLVDGFNTMIKDLKRHQREIADLSKKAAWAEMAQKVAHEIKNPLTPIQLSAEHILRVYEDRKGDFAKALKESASYIISEVENLRRIAQEFLELSRVTSLKKEEFDLREAIQEVSAPYKNMLSERIRFREIWEGREFKLLADKSKIKIAFRNIFVNAVEAIRGRGEVDIRLAAEPAQLVLEVKDSGSGIPPDVQEKIFDPYFSTKDVGTGLGLPIAKKIIEDHGGAIRVASEINRGTVITIALPRKAA
jgi:signal transduction histidine kinase